MAAINETSVDRFNIKLTSSEFPNLSVKGKQGQRVNLRKELNALMKERRRKSGSVSGKMSPSKKVEKKPDVEDIPTTKIGAQGAEPTAHKIYKPPVKKKKKELTVAQRAKRGPVKNKKGPAKMTGYGKDSGEPGFFDSMKESWQEAFRDKQPDDEATTVVKKDTMFGDGFMAPEEDVQQYKEKEVSATPSPHDRNIPEAQREVLKKPSFMGQRKWDKIPISQRRKVLENIKRTEEKNAIKSGVASDLFKEVSHILSAASPISWVNPADNKYTMLPHWDKKFRETVNLAQPKKTEEKVSELTDMDSKLKGEEGRRGQIEYGRGEYDRQEAPVVTNEDGGLMKELKPPKTDEISEEPVKYDVNGYPIYAKGSKKAAEWNAAYAAAKIGKFMWDGREYVKKGEPEEDEKAAVATDPVREAYDTGDANILEESFRAPEQAQPIAQAEPGEFPQSEGVAKHGPEWLPDISKKIKKISEENFDHEANLPEIQKLTKPLTKEETAQVKEEAGDWYVDPWTGFAIDLNKLQKRQDRKDSMEFAALLPADQRAAYLSMEGLIAPEDLEKLLEPSELEELQLQQAKISVDVASYKLVTAQLQRQDYRTPEQIAEADLKKTLEKERRGVAETTAAEERAVAIKKAAEERAAVTAISKYEREKKPVSNKAEMDRYAGLFKNAITNNAFELQVYWAKKMGFPPGKMEGIANRRAAWEIKQEKTKTGVSPFFEIFEFNYDKIINSRSKLLMGTASLWTTGDIDFQMGGKQIKSREGLLNTLGIEDYEDMTEVDAYDNPVKSPEEVIRMISSQSDLSIFKNEDYQDENGNPDWMSILDDEDIYKQFVLDNAIYKGMNAMHGGEYADILIYEAKRREKRYKEHRDYRQKVTNNQVK